jgi:pimeloyl-ACP methyl ester carboxylesterase
VNGPDSFPDFDQILARTVAHNPGRTVSSLRRARSARVAHVEEAGHSVQGDAPLELARLIDEFVA